MKTNPPIIIAPIRGSKPMGTKPRNPFKDLFSFKELCGDECLACICPAVEPPCADKEEGSRLRPSGLRV